MTWEVKGRTQWDIRRIALEIKCSFADQALRCIPQWRHLDGYHNGESITTVMCLYPVLRVVRLCKQEAQCVCASKRHNTLWCETEATLAGHSASVLGIMVLSIAPPLHAPWQRFKFEIIFETQIVLIFGVLISCVCAASSSHARLPILSYLQQHQHARDSSVAFSSMTDLVKSRELPIRLAKEALSMNNLVVTLDVNPGWLTDLIQSDMPSPIV